MFTEVYMQRSGKLISCGKRH